MMVRTIQHPGVQIQESELGSYSSTVIMNNAYIMGFTDRGPIYDYSYITTTREFVKIYGEPQTEAEKYLFIAVQSVLQNGGTPIVARMPYDNKQCKAYKALKMKWADKTDLIAPKKDTDLATPVIPLSSLTDELDKDKSFYDLFAPEHVFFNGDPGTEKMSDDGNTLLVDTITIPQAAMLLNPYKSGNPNSNGEIYDELKGLTGLKINGVYPSSLNIDQAAITSLVDSLKGDTTDRAINVYKFDEGFNERKYESLETVTDGFLSESSSGAFLYKSYIYLPKTVTENKLDEYGEPVYDDNGSIVTVDVDRSFYVDLYGKHDNGDTLSGFPVYQINAIPEEEYGWLYSVLSGVNTDSWKFVDAKYSGAAGYEIKTSGYFDDAVAGLGKLINGVGSAAGVSVVKDDVPFAFFDDSSSSNYVVMPVAKQKNGAKVKVYNNASVVKGLASFIASAHINSICLEAALMETEAPSGYTADDLAAAETAFETAFSKSAVKSLTDWHSSANGEWEFTGTKIAASTLNDTVQEQYWLDALIPIFANTQNFWITEGTTVKNAILTPDALPSYKTAKLIGFINYDEEMPAAEGQVKVSDLDEAFRRKLGLTDKDILSATFPVWSKFDAVQKVKLDETNLSAYQIYDPVEGIYLKSLSDTTAEDWASNFYNGAVESYYINPTKKSGVGRYLESSLNQWIGEGNVTVTKYWRVPYRFSLEDAPIRGVDDDLILENEPLVWLKTIYNDARLLNLDQENYTLLEAKLLETPEMGFKYMLSIDSEDVEISNDQFDDLVTVNQFKAVDRSIDKYGQDIDDANFIIVDKQKTVVQGTGGNIGYFTVVVDPFDALKVQRTLVNPAENGSDNPSQRTVKSDALKREKTFNFDHTEANIHRLDYWAYESADSWNQIYEDLLDSMDCLERVRNADGVYIGEPNPTNGKLNILDSWSIPLTGTYYEDSISKQLMKKFPAIPMADITSEDLEDPNYQPSIIDHNFATHILVAVCKTTIDPSNGKIVVNLVETFFGSLFDERDPQNGRSLFIGDIINGDNGSDYIQFFRNDYVSAGDKGAYDPPEYRRTDVNQIFIKDSDALRNAAAMRGIDYEDYGCDALDEKVKAKHEAQYYADLHKYHIWEIDKKEVCIYNLHWEANLTSFSKKESQKVIANTTGLYSVNDGTTVNVANNFLIDMDRCIKFIKNIDAIPLHFVCDAGLSTIAQFCDNVVWNPKKKSVVGEYTDERGRKTGVKKYEQTGGWITQPFDPDNDPDGDDRYITGYEDIATWRKVVEKLTSIAQDIRKDCFVIVDAPRQLTLDGAAPKIRVTKFTNNFDKVIAKALRYITGFNSSYVGGYYNWLRTTDLYTGRSIWIPPTSKIIGNYCFLNISNLPWLAPAGLTYGLISGCHAVSHNPDPQEEDQIYMKSWNYIKQYPLEGLVVEGQRTLLGKQSNFERINVRLLFLDLERYAYNVSRTFKYQVNNAYTREQFVATLKPKFEDYTLRGGIYQYYIKVDETNNTPETIDANELRGDIFVKPARLIEFILLNFCATTTAFDFSELQLG